MARYQDAIKWMADNDDNEWVDGDPEAADGTLSVTASMTADLFGKADEEVRADLKKALRKDGGKRRNHKDASH